MNWEKYNDKKHWSIDWLELETKYIGWLYASMNIHPQISNLLRKKFGIYPPDSFVSRPLMEQMWQALRQKYIYTRTIPCVYPGDEGKWALDQDRRIKNSVWCNERYDECGYVS